MGCVGALEGKRLVVMGGTGGIGLSASRAFVREGARVVAVGRDDEGAALFRGVVGAAGEAVVGDARDPGVSESAIGACEARFGGFEGLYHVAGGSGRAFGDGALHDLTDESVPRTLELNLSSVIYSNRAAVRAFRRNGGGGAILNMGSVLGWSPSPGHFATHVYAAAKAGIAGFSRSVAAYYAGEGIRVNVIAPGLVETPMARRAAGDAAIMAFIRRKQPLDGGRIGRPEDLDAAAVFFLSDAAKFCTGQVLAIDGGWCVSDGWVA